MPRAIMPRAIKADVLQTLADWQAGKPVRSIELGHVHRMIEHPGMSPRIDLSERVSIDQERAHGYCFAILAGTADFAPDFAEFSAFCEELAKQWKDVTPEERAAAESLAWKALLLGWKRAIDGHGEANYIEVTRPKGKAKK